MTSIAPSRCEVTQIRSEDRDEGSAESDLIRRAKHDPAAFGRLYRSHYPRIAGYLYRRTGDMHTAEDLAGEVFLAALNGIKRYRDRGIPFEHWLLRIATNQANRWAARSKRGAALSEEMQPACDGAQIDGDDGVVLAALQTLTPEHQAVLSLHHVEGLSVEAVSLVLGCRVGTVKSRLSRARDALRLALDGKEVDA